MQYIQFRVYRHIPSRIASISSAHVAARATGVTPTIQVANLARSSAERGGGGGGVLRSYGGLLFVRTGTGPR